MAVVEYDGTHFSGFQLQPNSNTRTVQGELEAALTHITGQRIRVAGAGRTDAGAHAKGQVISFRADARFDTPVLQRALNGVLPDDVCILTVGEVPEEFHARYSARARWYRYTLANRKVAPALRRCYLHHIRRPLDIEAMQCGCRYLVGPHDFKAFGSGTTTVRLMNRAKCERSSELVSIDLVANAFLKGMVRNIVGTLIRVGVGSLSPDDVEVILSKGDRTLAGPSVPAKGLCLMAVYYREADANDYV